MKGKIEVVCEKFLLPGNYVGYKEITMGNINKTYRVDYIENGVNKHYLLQYINSYVFKDPVVVMKNIDYVTEYVRKNTLKRTTIHYHHTADRKNYVLLNDEYWRLCNYIPSITYSSCSNLDVVRSAGLAFGEFQELLSDFDCSLIKTTIPNFHNTRKYYEKLKNDIQKDEVGLVENAKPIIDWLLSVEEKACLLCNLVENNELPLRVTHNDTKINNILFDEYTNEPITVIDLDTVMPGLVAHDFGDAVRFVANKVEEDSPDFKNAGINLDIYKAFANGFLSKVKDILTEKEKETLSDSVFCLAVELSVRFIDDYICGSKYFKIKYPEHNFVRARCQAYLAMDIMKNETEMKEIMKEML